METLDATASAPAAKSQQRSSDPQHPRLLPTYDLYRRLRHVVVGLEGARSTEALIAQLLALFADTATPDGELIRAAHAYHRRARAYARVASRGQGGPAWLGDCLSADHPLVRELRRSGVASTGVGYADAATVAAVAFGGKREFLLVFVLAGPLPEQETASFLAALGSLADMALRHRDSPPPWPRRGRSKRLCCSPSRRSSRATRSPSARGRRQWWAATSTTS
jgi:hypothetical protein